MSATGGVPLAEEPKGKDLTCEFCECRLFASGEVKKKSDAAKGFDKQRDRIESLETEIETLKQRVASLMEERDTLAKELEKRPPVTETPASATPTTCGKKYDLRL